MVQIDPAAADTTPKLRFSWKKDGKLSKDLTCLLRGKTTAIPETKTKSKEPDITVSIFKGLRELTLYEPNLYRVEMEDFKGLEVVLLLGAITIRDVYFASPKEAFRISRQNSASVSPTSNSPTTTPSTNRLPASPSGLVTDIPPAPQPPPVHSPQLTKQQEQARKEEERRTKRLLEEEEKAHRRRQAEVDKETRRLQKLYGEEERKARAQTSALPPRKPPRPQYNHAGPSMPHSGSRPYLQLPGQMSTMSLLTPPVAGPQTAAKPHLQNKRSSFFGLRRVSEDGKLSKKRSSMF
jgi:type IV secretory pathway VirB10-like protein